MTSKKKNRNKSQGGQTSRNRPARRGANARNVSWSRDEVKNARAALQPTEQLVFLSYARDDDLNLEFIEPFKELLSKFVHLKTGRRITTFLDQTDIGWGEYWRDKLEQSIMGASVFIPLLTAAYLESENCRWEFTQFQMKASRVDAIDLMLPVMVVQAPQVFNPESEDSIVQTALKLQYESIQEAVLSERGSSEWKRTMSRIADRFCAAQAVAEAKLIDSMERSVDTAEPPLGTDGDDSDAPGLVELLVAMQDQVNGMAKLAQELHPAIDELGDAARAAGEPKAANPRELLQWGIHAARGMAHPAERIGELGDALLLETRGLDRTIGGLARVGKQIPGVDEKLEEVLQGFGQLDSVREQLVSMLNGMVPVEEFSVPLRKVLRPARTGVTKVNDALAIIEGWQAPQRG